MDPVGCFVLGALAGGAVVWVLFTRAIRAAREQFEATLRKPRPPATLPFKPREDAPPLKVYRDD